MGNPPERPAHISQGDWDEVDVPELDADDFARSRPFKEVFPKQFQAWKALGRPPLENPKIHIGFRLAADVVEGIKATGKGYNARVERVLREALLGGKF